MSNIAEPRTELIDTINTFEYEGIRFEIKLKVPSYATMKIVRQVENEYPELISKLSELEKRQMELIKYLSPEELKQVQDADVLEREDLAGRIFQNKIMTDPELLSEIQGKDLTKDDKIQLAEFQIKLFTRLIDERLLDEKVRPFFNDKVINETVASLDIAKIRTLLNSFRSVCGV